MNPHDSLPSQQLSSWQRRRTQGWLPSRKSRGDICDSPSPAAPVRHQQRLAAKSLTEGIHSPRERHGSGTGWSRGRDTHAVRGPLPGLPSAPVSTGWAHLPPCCSPPGACARGLRATPPAPHPATCGCKALPTSLTLGNPPGTVAKKQPSHPEVRCREVLFHSQALWRLTQPQAEASDLDDLVWGFNRQ